MTFFDTPVMSMPLSRWLVATAVGLGTFVLLRFVSRWLVRRITRTAESTDTPWDDVLAHVLGATKEWFILVAAVFVATRGLELSSSVHGLISRITIIALIVQGGLWVNRGLGSWLAVYRELRLEHDRAAVTTLAAVGFMGRLATWVVVLLLGLDNLGIDVTALVAGLGVAGIAVALAVQNILGDLFASLSIVLDKPFVIGDFLAVGDMMGSVEYVGLKTTRLRSLSGEQLVFSNSDLLGSRIRNFGRMAERRALFTIGVTYQTPREKLERIPEMIREAVEAQPQTRFDRSHFAKYGDSAITFETVYYVTVPEYTVYMDTQQAINLQIHEAFEREGIEFAYPTQTVFLTKQTS